MLNRPTKTKPTSRFEVEDPAKMLQSLELKLISHHAQMKIRARFREANYFLKIIYHYRNEQIINTSEPN